MERASVTDARWRAAPALDAPALVVEGCSLSLGVQPAIAHIGCADDRTDELARRLFDAFGLALAPSPRLARGGGMDLAPAGPRRWLAISEDAEPGRLLDDLGAALGGVAILVDVSDAHAVLRLAGVRAREVLALSVPLDLDPLAFAEGHVARTHADHVGITLIQRDALPTFDILVPRSYVRDVHESLRIALQSLTPTTKRTE